MICLMESNGLYFFVVMAPPTYVSPSYQNTW
jgi:hypothetical protein